jgi:hypothetical protein
MRELEDWERNVVEDECRECARSGVQVERDVVIGLVFEVHE